MSKKLILLVEDNLDILNSNKFFFERNGYEVETATTLSAAKTKLAKRQPDLIVLDIMLPDGSGIDFLKDVRKEHSTAVLLLTSLTESSNVVRGFDNGADDYLAKPYDYNVLLARVKSLLRRTQRMPEILKFGALKFDVLSQRVFLENDDMLLPPKQFALLFLLAQNSGKTLSAEYLYQMVWNQPITSDKGALWAQMSRLKSKLQKSEKISLSQFRGDGYCLEIII